MEEYKRPLRLEELPEPCEQFAALGGILDQQSGSTRKLLPTFSDYMESSRSVFPCPPELVEVCVYNAKAFKMKSTALPCLSLEQLAAVYLYTTHNHFHAVLNESLRRQKREGLKPFFPYLKLLLGALQEMQCYSVLVYKGVKGDATPEYPKGKRFFWWTFTSCTMSMAVLEGADYCGASGTRTVFHIQAKYARSLQHFMGQGEGEVLLCPGTYLEVKSVTDAGEGLKVVQLEEIEPPSPSIPGLKSLESTTLVPLVDDYDITIITEPIFYTEDVKNHSFYTKREFLAIEKAVSSFQHLVPNIMEFVKEIKNKLDSKLKQLYPFLNTDQILSLCLFCQMNTLLFKMNEALKTRKHVDCFVEYFKLFFPALLLLRVQKRIIWFAVDADIRPVYEKADKLIFWGLSGCTLELGTDIKRNMIKLFGNVIDLTDFSKGRNFKIVSPGQVFDIRTTNSNYIELLESNVPFIWIDFNYDASPPPVTKTNPNIFKTFKQSIFSKSSKNQTETITCIARLVNQNGRCDQRKYHKCLITNNPDKVQEIKITLLGPGSIGAKSSLIAQFIKNQFPEEYDPTIEDSYKKQFEVDGITYYGDFLDTAGQEEYASMRESWIRNSHGFLLGYSITSYSSFTETINSFYSEILRVKDTDWVPIVLVGNKCDLESERQVQKEQAMTWAKMKGFPFFETSALTRENLVEAIHTLVRLTHLHQITAENYIPYHYQKELDKNPK